MRGLFCPAACNLYAYAPVAQLDRALAFGARRCRFDSCQARLAHAALKGIQALFFIILFFIGAAETFAEEPPARRAVCFKDSCFRVETAEDRLRQEKGLMFVDSLPEDSGMLFIYDDEAPRSFYMKNTLIPLDIIWINKYRKVVFIKRDAQPERSGEYETFCPEEKAMYVLELNAGSVDRMGLMYGDELQFESF